MVKSSPRFDGIPNARKYTVILLVTVLGAFLFFELAHCQWTLILSPGTSFMVQQPRWIAGTILSLGLLLTGIIEQAVEKLRPSLLAMGEGSHP
jgi:hypothetical protein